MLLYLLRHANADTVAARDSERALSEKGVQQAQKIARFCEAKELEPQVIISSPYLRAQQTAAAVAKHLKLELLIEPWLASGMQPESAAEELRLRRDVERLMIVGHEPDLSGLISHLLGMPDEGNIEIRKGSLTALEIFSFRPCGARLLFSLPCRLM